MRYWLCLATSLVAFGAAAFAADEPAPAPALPVASRPGPEVFGALPILRHPALSPDGTFFACIQSFKGRPVVTINKIGDTSGKWPVMLPVPDMVIDDFIWAKNDRLILRLKWSRAPSGEQETFYHYVGVTADGTTAVPLAEEKAAAASVTTSLHHRAYIWQIVDVAYDDPTNIYAHMTDGGLARIDITTGEVRSNTDPNFAKDRVVRKWITDGHGKAIARVDQTFDPLVDHLMVNDDGDWREVAKGPADTDKGIYAAGLMYDGKALAVYADAEEPSFSAYRIELAPGHARSPLYSAGKYDLSGLMVDERTKRINGAGWSDETEHTVYFDPELAAIQRGLDTQFPGKNIQIVSIDLARSKVFFRVSAANEAPVYLYLNRTTHIAKPIGRMFPGLREADLGLMKPYPYTARDGLAIPGYLTLPPGKGEKNLPIIVMPHPFATARSVSAFDWWRQFYANRGYAVLEPNYRGSYGYGRDFRRAGWKQLGLKIQDDIADGVTKLIADGIADPKRICIVGEEFAGYAALAGAAFTPGLYACAVSVNGVSDLPRLWADVSRDIRRTGKAYSTWQTWIGDRYDDSAQLDATSPALHADKITIPVLLIHSTGNSLIRIEQSEAMERSLKRAGRPVELIRLEGDTGDLDTAEAQIRMLTETERFIAKAIGN